MKIHADDKMSITSITVKLDRSLQVTDVFSKFQRQLDRMRDGPTAVRRFVTARVAYLLYIEDAYVFVFSHYAWSDQFSSVVANSVL